jgi:hypothetical protein
VDVIWLDAFNGAYIPDHLTSVEFIKLTREVLTLEGLLVQNLHQTRFHFYLRQLAASRDLFENPPLLFSGSRCSNTIAVCPNGPTPLPRQPKDLAKAARAFGSRVGPYDLLEETRKVKPFPNISSYKY